MPRVPVQERDPEQEQAPREREQAPRERVQVRDPEQVQVQEQVRDPVQVQVRVLQGWD